MTAAAMETYRANQVAGYASISADDQRVCEQCADNEAAGPIPLGDSLPFGAPVSCYPPTQRRPPEIAGSSSAPAGFSQVEETMVLPRRQQEQKPPDAANLITCPSCGEQS